VQLASVGSHRHASGERKRFWYLETRKASNGTGDGKEAVAVDPQLAAQRQARRALEAFSDRNYGKIAFVAYWGSIPQRISLHSHGRGRAYAGWERRWAPEPKQRIDAVVRYLRRKNFPKWNIICRRTPWLCHNNVSLDTEQV